MFKLLYSFLFFMMLLLTSCQTHKKLVYFQNEITDEGKTNFTPTLKTDDFISIIVAGDNPEVVAVFNFSPILGNTGNVNNGYTQGNNEKSGYLIDADGNIHLPILGSIEIAGLNRMEATAMLKEKLNVYVNNPVVNIQILNFKVTVLGDVNKPGSFKVPNERITILEAIGLAGDLKITGVRNNVLVIRDNNGKKQEFRVDLTNNTLFNSPIYYLQQNDVVYIEPNSAARSNSTIWKTTGSVFISLTSLIITTVTLISSK